MSCFWILVPCWAAQSRRSFSVIKLALLQAVLAAMAARCRGALRAGGGVLGEWHTLALSRPGERRVRIEAVVQLVVVPGVAETIELGRALEEHRACSRRHIRGPPGSAWSLPDT